MEFAKCEMRFDYSIDFYEMDVNGDSSYRACRFTDVRRSGVLAPMSGIVHCSVADGETKGTSYLPAPLGREHD